MAPVLALNARAVVPVAETLAAAPKVCVKAATVKAPSVPVAVNRVLQEISAPELVSSASTRYLIKPTSYVALETVAGADIASQPPAIADVKLAILVAPLVTILR